MKTLLLSLITILVLGTPAIAQKYDLNEVISHKWKVIWFADDGVKQMMEVKKQQLIMKSDGTGTMFMMGQKIGDVKWSVIGKNTINFQDDPTFPGYTVKVSKYKKGTNMLFKGKLPTGVERQVYFEILSGK